MCRDVKLLHPCFSIERREFYLEYEVNITRVLEAYSVRAQKTSVFCEQVQKENSLYYSLLYVRDGSAEVSFKGRKRIYEAGTVFISGCGEKDFFVSGGELVCISFVTDRVLRFLNEGVKTRCICFNGDEEIKEFFDSTVKRFNSIGYLNLAGAKISVMCIMQKIFEAMQGENPLPEVLEQALAYIHQMAFEETINIRKLAEDREVNYEYLIRLFNRYMGCSPKKWITDRKLFRVTHMLKRTDFDIPRIASESGFSSMPFFDKAFKRKFGITPRKYRVLYMEKRKKLPVRIPGNDFSIEYLYHIFTTRKYGKWKRTFEINDKSGANYHISLLKEGRIEYATGEEKKVLGAGTVIYSSIWKNASYTCTSLLNPTMMISITFYMNEGFEKGPAGGENFIWGPENKDRIIEMFVKSNELHEENSMKNLMKIKILISNIIMDMVKEKISVMPEGEKKIYDAIGYMGVKGFSENINIRSLAVQYGLSYEYFIRLFRKVTGISPKQYINSMRLEKAEILLRTLKEPISLIAEKSGFFDVSYFNEAFREVYKMTPRQFRSLAEKGEI